MDNRLDFYNVLNKHIETLTENDYLIVISHNDKDGDLIITHCGDKERLTAIFSIDGYVNTTEESSDTYDRIKAFILNSAVNIMNNEEDIKNKIISHFVN